MEVREGFIPVIGPELYYIHPQSYYGVQVGRYYTFLKRSGLTKNKIDRIKEELRRMQ